MHSNRTSPTKFESTNASRSLDSSNAVFAVVLLAIDVNAFYAQCHLKADASLAGVPVAVVQRSFVTTTNHIARQLGAPKCGSISEVRAACPSIVLVQQNMQLYRLESVALHRLLCEQFPGCAIERSGVDEFFVDVSSLSYDLSLVEVPRGSWLFGHDSRAFVLLSDDCEAPRVLCGDDVVALQAAKIAQTLAQTILSRLQLTVSIGVGFSRPVAKHAAGSHKPAGVTTCFVARGVDLLDQVPLRAIAGIGSKLRSRIAAFGCETCGQLRERVSLQQLLDAAGETGQMLFSVVRGIDNEPLKADSIEPATVSAESFARDIGTARKFNVFFAALAEQLASRLLCDRDTFRRIATSFSLRVRYTEHIDDSFRDVKLISRAIAAVSYAEGNQRTLAQSLFRNAMQVLRGGGAPPISQFLQGNCRAETPIIRGLGLAASSFVATQSRNIGAFFGASASAPVAAADAADAVDAIELEDLARDIFARPDDFDVAELPSFLAWRWSEADLLMQETTAASSPSSASSSAKRALAVLCDRCGARFTGESELAVHADWHAAVDLRDADLVVPKKKPTAAPANKKQKSLGALDSFVIRKSE
jgi:nucleotidyltransferase/DNA polymerase involved in DNA repair